MRFSIAEVRSAFIVVELSFEACLMCSTLAHPRQYFSANQPSDILIFVSHRFCSCDRQAIPCACM